MNGYFILTVDAETEQYSVGSNKVATVTAIIIYYKNTFIIFDLVKKKEVYRILECYESECECVCEHFYFMYFISD